MGPDPLEGQPGASPDELLQELCRGDVAAAERVFRAYEPYLRKVVRRQLPAHLRAKFDSLDVVQSAWADLLTGFREAGWRFPNAASLRAFLIQVTRNRFIDRVRQHDAVLAREETLPASELATRSASPAPPPAQQAEADELWERMLALCPPEHHGLLRLRREGYSLQEIATRTGLHEGSVRRILRTLACQLAFRKSPPSSAADPSPGP